MSETVFRTKSNMEPFISVVRLRWYLLVLFAITRTSSGFSYNKESREDSSTDEPLFETIYTLPTPSKSYTEIPGGLLLGGGGPAKILDKAGSPYLILDDWIVERGAELRIEPGVELRFKPMVGLTIRGRLLAVGTTEDRISFVSDEAGSGAMDRGVRLVDGPAPTSGRLQLLHLGSWRSVCSNSRNWTLSDFGTVCRSLGYAGGRFYQWFDAERRGAGFDRRLPRLLLERPECAGSESALAGCKRWNTRQLGAGVCDFHGDVGVQCENRHGLDYNTKTTSNWRGLRFEHAENERRLTQDNTLYITTSRSVLQNVDIVHAGSGNRANTTAGLSVRGVAPLMHNVRVLNSAYHGTEILDTDAPVVMTNCELRGNAGYGLLVNSTYGQVLLENCTIFGNGADGIRHIMHDVDPRELRRDRTDVHEFCTLPTTVSQTYPVRISIEQSKYSYNERDCGKYFTTRQGYVLTLNFVYFTTDKNDSATLDVFDGTSRHDKQLASFSVRNNSRAQSVTSTRNKIYVRFKSDSQVEVLGFLHLTAGKAKTFDLNVTRSDVADNNGKGITVENLRSLVHIHQSSISNNGYTAGLHVKRGVGDVNITESRISFNKGDGVNITYTGGNRNISRSSLSSNTRRGLAIWLNDTRETEYVNFNQTTVVEYSEVFRNLEEGILHGNFCGQGWINITANWFNESLDTSVDLGTCWQDGQKDKKLILQIGHNVFERNRKISIKIYPALNIDGKIEYNHIRHGEYGGILIKNQPFEEFEVLPSRIVLQNNELYNNKGVFVVNLGTSPYSNVQSVLFTRNFVTENAIREPFINEDGASFNLLPRSRVAAAVVVSSGTVDVFRNIIDNPDSKYEIGSQLEDQSKIINCTYNWLGKRDEEQIFHRLFHRKDRYNLAKIIYLPYLLHNSNPGANTIVAHPTYVPHFNVPGSGIVGGEVDGQENLKPGEYIVDKDINIRPGGKLTLQSGVTLKFPPSVGMMVAGKLEARGRNINAITMTLKQQTVMEQEVENMEMDTERYDTETQIVEVESKIPIRLLGGMSNNEGRLQVKIGTEWGTVCNYGWTMRNAALVCHQLGLVLNPDDWNLERNQIPNAGTSERIIMANVRCTEFDNDITQCRSEKGDDFENSCTHEHDVGVRCYQSNWAGLRLGVLAERADLQFITIEKAGLLDYATNAFQPALQIDFARHSLESIRVTDNLQDGLGVIYSDIYSADAVNIIRNSEFSNNRGSGISLKQLGLKVQGALIENNLVAGIKHDPVISGLQQKELAGWFNMAPDFNVLESGYNPIFVPEYEPATIDLETGLTKYLLTSRHVRQENIQKLYDIRCQPGYVIGIQLLNPIGNRSTERIWIHDSQNMNPLNEKWLLNRDLSVFPAASSSFGVVLEYKSGENALGGVVLVLSTIPAPRQIIMNKIIRGPVPTLTVMNTRVRRNAKGMQAWYYNRYLNEVGDHYLRKANESIKIINCEISHNYQEAVDVYSPFWDVHESNISEISISINNTLITDNGRGIMQFSRDMRNSNNLFHYILQDNSIERNQAGGFEISLPYVWDYNENFTHSVFVNNNTWRGNKLFSFIVDGHYAAVNLSKNSFSDNMCKVGLISIRGMEKQMKIDGNVIQRNNGKHMVEFKADSQSEILGEVKAIFAYNEIRSNRYVKYSKSDMHQLYRDPTCVVGFDGVQKVRVNRNLFSGNVLDYDLLAGIKTAKINNILDVRENWWGSENATVIKKRIFDFDDWNNHAVALFRPFLIEDSFDASVSVSFEDPTPIDLDYLGGRLMENLVLYKRDQPYVLQSDLTVMPDVTLTIRAGVEMEFAPNVGILVLGTLVAQGLRGSEILMRPMTVGTHFDNRVGRRSMRIIEFDEEGRQISKVIERSSNAEDLDVDVFKTVEADKSQRMVEDVSMKNRRSLESLVMHDTIRLCSGGNCSDSEEHGYTAQGFLEYYNKTTLQWVPMCDDRFTERNAQVVCRELGFDPINVFYQRDRRIEYHSNSLSRIWSWPEPLQCKGTESRYDDCPIRLNGQLYGHLHTCSWDSDFIFISCGRRNLDQPADYWGGIRFAHPEFEHRLYEHRVHDVRTHGVIRPPESVMEFVKIIGAGVLHNEKSPAIQSIVRSPSIGFVDINKSAHHGLNLVSPSASMDVRFLNVDHTLGDGINVVSLTGEGRESDESSFTPLKELNLPHSLFSLIDICDTAKEIIVEERVLVYYKYENSPVNCVKIFKSAYGVKPFGFRLLQFNLFNRTTAQDYGRPDEITLYDGDVYNISAPILGRIEANANGAERRFYKSTWQGLSVRLFASGASGTYGFVAEIVTLPISAIGFNRDAQHNLTHSTLSHCLTGALSYSAVGEVSPTLSLDKNQILDNCVQLYGNFSTCRAALRLDVQNMQNMYFRNNLVRGNQGGVWLRADSRGSATSLRGWFHNNLFTENFNLPTLYIEGRQSSPYQEVTIYRNYFTRNSLQYHDVIVLKQVVSNFSYNYVNSNKGARIMEISGFEKVRLPIYQTTTHNGFYNNYAVDPLGKATIVAGTAGQQYVDNIFFNPDNDYEMITVNRSITLELWKTKIDAAHNYWGYNTTLAVGSRVRDRADDVALVEVQYLPLHFTNSSVLDGKCPPGWGAVEDTCYAYIGAPMGFREARDFCRNDNASMPYLRSDTSSLRSFLESQHGLGGDPVASSSYDHRVWVQDIDRVDQCTAFEYRGVVLDDCQARHGFLCEIDPVVFIDPLLWTNDIVAIGVISSMAIAVLVLAMAVCCWYSKSRHRHAQRLQRRNSIRQSLRSLNSLEPGSMRRKNMSGSRSTDTLTVKTASDCKRMLTTSGSLDSIEKSVFTGSSLDDDRSFDVYEAHNPRTAYASNSNNLFSDTKRLYGANEFRDKNKDYEKPRYYANDLPSPTRTNNAPGYELAYRNEGYRDTSTFGAGKGLKDRGYATTTGLGNRNVDDSLEHNAGQSDYYNNASTLPLNSTLDKSMTESESLNLSQYSDRGLTFFKDASPDGVKLPTPEYASAHSTFRSPVRDPRLENGLPPAPPNAPQSYGIRNVPQYDRTAPNIPDIKPNVPQHLNVLPYDRAAPGIPEINQNLPESVPAYQQSVPSRNVPQMGQNIPPVVPPPTYVQINLTYKNPTTLIDGSPLERKVQNSDNVLLSDTESTTSSAGRRAMQKPIVPERSVLTPPLRPPPPPPISSPNPYERPQSAAILDSDVPLSPVRPKNYARSKSEAVLETSFDVEDEYPGPIEPLTKDSRSQSQPLETAM